MSVKTGHGSGDALTVFAFPCELNSHAAFIRSGNVAVNVAQTLDVEVYERAVVDPRDRRHIHEVERNTAFRDVPDIRAVFCVSDGCRRFAIMAVSSVAINGTKSPATDFLDVHFDSPIPNSRVHANHVP